jgi:hypothetical protein
MASGVNETRSSHQTGWTVHVLSGEVNGARKGVCDRSGNEGDAGRKYLLNSALCARMDDAARWQYARERVRSARRATESSFRERHMLEGQDRSGASDI